MLIVDFRALPSCLSSIGWRWSGSALWTTGVLWPKPSDHSIATIAAQKFWDSNVLYSVHFLSILSILCPVCWWFMIFIHDVCVWSANEIEKIAVHKRTFTFAKLLFGWSKLHVPSTYVQKCTKQLNAVGCALIWSSNSFLNWGFLATAPSNGICFSESQRTHTFSKGVYIDSCDMLWPLRFAAPEKKNRGFVAQCNLTSMTRNSMFYVIVIINIIINIIGIVVVVVVVVVVAVAVAVAVVVAVVVVVVDAAIIRIVFWHLLLLQLLCRISWNWL